MATVALAPGGARLPYCRTVIPAFPTKGKPVPLAPKLHIILVHYPIVDKQGDVAATSVTNLDIHDLSRAGRTYGVDGYWIVHPYPAMRRYVERIIEHWQEGFGAVYNPTRKDSLEVTRVSPDLDDVANQLAALYPGREVVWVGTSAKRTRRSLLFREMRAWLEDESDDKVYALLFGTGWGLHGEVLEEMDYMLEPIDGPTDWNHLSVRAAAAIILDRLLGLNR